MRERNFVHFALMGRDDISMEMLKSVNGVTNECKIIFHGMFSVSEIVKGSNQS
jgi:hypothetical protein